MRRLSDAIHAFLKSRYFYPLAFLAAATPGLLLGSKIYQALTTDPSALGVNPVETMLHATGKYALALLLTALTVTPVRRLTGWNRVQIVRRMLGVWSFFYALCHFGIYVTFDQLGDVRAIVEDVTKRRFIFVGMLAFSILLVLAATSTNRAIRLLGRRWQTLHRLVYVAVAAGAVHFIWGQKSNIREPLIWSAYAVLLLGLRVWFRVRKRKPALRPA